MRHKTDEQKIGRGERWRKLEKNRGKLDKIINELPHFAESHPDRQ